MRGKGVYLWDDAGRRFLDVASGAFLANLGQGNERVLRAMYEQGRRFTYTYVRNTRHHANARLVDHLTRLAGPVFERAMCAQAVPTPSRWRSEDPNWNNSTVLKGDVLAEVSKMKQEIAGDILVYGSFQLLHTMMDHDLIDELRLMIYPVVLGAGERLFGETSDRKPMRLLNVKTVGDDLALLTYEPVRARSANE
jgi:dihydrofolate reductase